MRPPKTDCIFEIREFLSFKVVAIKRMFFLLFYVFFDVESESEVRRPSFWVIKIIGIK